jgi:hypothetical protein
MFETMKFEAAKIRLRFWHWVFSRKLSDLGQGCFAARARDCTKVNPPPVLGNGSVDHQHHSNDDHQAKDHDQRIQGVLSPAKLAGLR